MVVHTTSGMACCECKADSAISVISSDTQDSMQRYTILSLVGCNSRRLQTGTAAFSFGAGSRKFVETHAESRNEEEDGSAAAQPVAYPVYRASQF